MLAAVSPRRQALPAAVYRPTDTSLSPFSGRTPNHCAAICVMIVYVPVPMSAFRRLPKTCHPHSGGPTHSMGIRRVGYTGDAILQPVSVLPSFMERGSIRRLASRIFQHAADNITAETYSTTAYCPEDLSPHKFSSETQPDPFGASKPFHPLLLEEHRCRLLRREPVQEIRSRKRSDGNKYGAAAGDRTSQLELSWSRLLLRSRSRLLLRSSQTRAALRPHSTPAHSNHEV